MLKPHVDGEFITQKFLSISSILNNNLENDLTIDFK